MQVCVQIEVSKCFSVEIHFKIGNKQRYIDSLQFLQVPAAVQLNQAVRHQIGSRYRSDACSQVNQLPQPNIFNVFSECVKQTGLKNIYKFKNLFFSFKNTNKMYIVNAVKKVCRTNR